MRIQNLILFSVIGIFIAGNDGRAVNITLKATGEITSISPQLDVNWIGRSFDLYYTFSSTAIDLDLSNTLRGQYQLLSMALDVNAYHAQSADGISGLIVVDNDGFFIPRDRLTLNSSSPSGFYSHPAPLIGDRQLISIVVQLTDNDANVFNADGLPLAPLDVSEFESAQLELLFSNHWQSDVAFDATRVSGRIRTITSIPISSSVPEPATYIMFVFVLAGLMVSRLTCLKWQSFCN